MATLGALPSPLSILIVEDDSEALKMISILMAQKFPAVTIRTAGDGNKGVELSLERTPDIVITDINMAGMDGVQMAGEIRVIGLNTRFIVLTGYSDKEHLDLFSTIGVSAYIVKPINFKKLFAAFEKCIEEISLEGCADGC